MEKRSTLREGIGKGGASVVDGGGREWEEEEEEKRGRKGGLGEREEK
jgi:hypothetical protein